MEKPTTDNSKILIAQRISHPGIFIVGKFRIIAQAN